MDIPCRHAIVESYLSDRSIARARFKDLPAPAKWYLLGIAAAEAAACPYTHALTVHLDNAREQAIKAVIGTIDSSCAPDPGRNHGHGCGRMIGTLFINRKLEPIYRRAGLSLRYAYALEINRGARDARDGQTLHGRGGYGLIHATILLSIPEELAAKVVRAIARHFETHQTRLTRRNSGSPAYLTLISGKKVFAKGGSATLHGAVLGVMDYVAKGFHIVDDLRVFYEREAVTGYNPVGSKPIGADRASWEGAEAIYDELWRWWGNAMSPTWVGLGRVVN